MTEGSCPSFHKKKAAGIWVSAAAVGLGYISLKYPIHIAGHDVQAKHHKVDKGRRGKEGSSSSVLAPATCLKAAHAALRFGGGITTTAHGTIFMPSP